MMVKDCRGRIEVGDRVRSNGNDPAYDRTEQDRVS